MRSFVLKVLMPILKLTRGFPFKDRYSGEVQILMLHRVVDSIGENRINNDGIEITRDYLEYLINFYLKNKFIPISIDDFSKLKGGKSKERYVVFSFDDGYLDNYEKALPIFEKYNVPFAVYISTDFIFKKQFAWWYFLEDLINANSEIRYLNKGGEPIVLNKESRADKVDCFVKMRGVIQNDISILTQLIDAYKPDINKYYNLFLNTEQLALFAKHPLVTIGSHSLSHPSLAKCTDEESLNEIYNSKHELEKIIEKPVMHFSYPFGTTNDVSKREMKNVKEAGYLTALTTSYGDVYINKDTNLFALNRIWTGNDNAEKELYETIYGINAYRKKS
ncbi:MAG TPA: polysaccharide deacetylase family protein [Bacteroidia bacterium]|nr:polysaccharide deacetylase family protein [Bacteroidia bacterium]